HVADRLDVVSVEVENESGVVAGVVLRPQARRAVVATTGPERCLVEGANLDPALDSEGKMHRRSRLAVAPDPELGLPTLAEAAGPDLALGPLRPDLHHQADPEWSECRRIKRLGTFVLRDPETA